jgi:hypothetical protein
VIIRPTTLFYHKKIGSSNDAKRRNEKIESVIKHSKHVAWKKKTQCKAINQIQNQQTTLQESKRLFLNTTDRNTAAKSMRYQTMASVMVINAPRTAVKPQITQSWNLNNF